MIAIDWILLVFVFSFGSCIGSFLNVVIYRLPLEKSIVKPPSACPVCNMFIKFYDNIPLLSWILLGAKCRNCKTPISARYFIIEFLTALVFTGLFYLFFYSGFRGDIPALTEGGWFVWLMYVSLAGGLIASSAIDSQLWIIPISICWFVSICGIIGSMAGPFLIDPAEIAARNIFPTASPACASIAIGASIGTIISLLLLKTGLLKMSYESFDEIEWPPKDNGSTQSNDSDGVNINHRVEMLKEILFLVPILIFAFLGYFILVKTELFRVAWVDIITQHPVIAGLTGSLFGYFAGAAIVWLTRIAGTLAFNKEAMGLGDVHLMAAAGTVIGPFFVIVAFFVAPFFGLIWIVANVFFKKIKQIPYGPFLSLAVIVVIILHDWFLSKFVMFR